MTTQPPPIDRRTAAEIAKQLQDLLAVYAPNWRELDPLTRKPTGISAALMGVFARFSEIIIGRLNQVPEKNFLAFLDLLGVSRLPPQPARVPLTFSLAAGSTVEVLVPAGTQVAAPPAEGEKEPVIFETERELVVAAAPLRAIFVRNPEQDQYADYSALVKLAARDREASPLDVPVFQGNRPLEHSFSLGHDTLLRYPALKGLRLHFELTENIPDSPENPKDGRTLQWEIGNGVQGIPLSPTADTTQSLTQSGEVVFGTDETDAKPLPEFPQQTVHTFTSRWLRCRLLTPITPALEKQTGMVRANRQLPLIKQLPSIETLTLQATFKANDLAVETAFMNLLPVDLSKPFFPFGEKPKFGDTLYLANAEAFSKSGAEVTLQVNVVNPLATGITPTEAAKEFAPVLQWEVWDGETETWLLIGTSTRDGPQQAVPPNNFRDTTQAFTVPGEGRVSFTLPGQPTAKSVNGSESFWIRVQITAGNYGEDAKYVPSRDSDSGFAFSPATFVPPLIKSMRVQYAVTQEESPTQVLTDNDFVTDSIAIAPGQSFAPFQPTKDTKPTLYLGFTLPPERSFPNRPLSLFCRTADFKYGERSIQTVADTELPTPERLQLAWEYWNGAAWSRLTVRDDSENFTRSGLVEFLPPTDFAARAEFGLPACYWLRAVWERGDYPIPPQLSWVLLNTTIAAQTVTLRNEILGSSDGSENQRFRTTRSPLLNGQQLEVREPELPAAEEQERLVQEEGKDAMSQVLDATGRPKEIWVRWHEVPDFYGSGPRDRHYVLDHLTGEIRFGDRRNGLIPPLGTGNLRLIRYQTGGGTAGNKPAQTIVQLKTTIPYIEAVTNPEAAAGGADAQTLDSLLDQAPRTLRHRFRAVTLEDYEDLAQLASSEVARAKCVPLRLFKLLDDVPEAQSLEPGAVSVIIVPQTTAAQPLPSLELIRRVQDYLKANSSLTASVAVVGPQYVSVSVNIEIALTSLEGASAVEQVVARKLASFLHPLTGGLDGTGWDFGREPYKSDFYRQIESVPGVDHIRNLTLKLTVDGREDPQAVQAIKQTGLFLVHSGQHTINLVFEES